MKHWVNRPVDTEGWYQTVGNTFLMGLILQLLALRCSTYVDLSRHVNMLIVRSRAHSAPSQPYSCYRSDGFISLSCLNTTHFNVIMEISPEKHRLCAALWFHLDQKQAGQIIFWDTAVLRNQVVPQLMCKQTCKSLGCLWKQFFLWNQWLNRGRIQVSQNWELCFYYCLACSPCMLVIMHIR